VQSVFWSHGIHFPSDATKVPKGWMASKRKLLKEHLMHDGWTARLSPNGKEFQIL
jgi:hypothetical protein